MNTVIKLFETAARADRAAIIVARIGLVVVLLWIGGLEAFAYEDEGIVPFVANSPLMSFFYRQPAGEYRQHMTPPVNWCLPTGSGMSGTGPTCLPTGSAP
jgi:uncharacterized membrane protein YkgB